MWSAYEHSQSGNISHSISVAAAKLMSTTAHDQLTRSNESRLDQCNSLTCAAAATLGQTQAHGCDLRRLSSSLAVMCAVWASFDLSVDRFY